MHSLWWVMISRAVSERTKWPNWWLMAHITCTRDAAWRVFVGIISDIWWRNTVTGNIFQPPRDDDDSTGQYTLEACWRQSLGQQCDLVRRPKKATALSSNFAVGRLGRVVDTIFSSINPSRTVRGGAWPRPSDRWPPLPSQFVGRTGSMRCSWQWQCGGLTEG